MSGPDWLCRNCALVRLGSELANVASTVAAPPPQRLVLGIDLWVVPACHTPVVHVNDHATGCVRVVGMSSSGAAITDAIGRSQSCRTTSDNCRNDSCCLKDCKPAEKTEPLAGVRVDSTNGCNVAAASGQMPPPSTQPVAAAQVGGCRLQARAGLQFRSRRSVSRSRCRSQANSTPLSMS